jgi:hypothetical protein
MTGYSSEAEIKSRIATSIALVVILLAALAAVVVLFLPTDVDERSHKPGAALFLVMSAHA